MVYKQAWSIKIIDTFETYQEATWEKEEDLRTAYPEFFRYTLPQTWGRSFC
jgi:hypothetical protein